MGQAELPLPPMMDEEGEEHSPVTFLFKGFLLLKIGFKRKRKSLFIMKLFYSSQNFFFSLVWAGSFSVLLGRRRGSLAQLSIPQASDLNILWCLGSEVGIRWLDALKDSSNLTSGAVDRGRAKNNASLKNLRGLCVFLLELLGVTCGWEGNSSVITGGGTSTLRVQKGGSSVGWDDEVTSELTQVTLSNEFLDGEQEWNALSSWKLNGGGGIVNTVLLLELDASVTSYFEFSRDLGKGVRQASHELGLDEVGLGALSDSLFLDFEAGWLQAELGNVVVSCLQGLQVRDAIV